MILKGSQAYHQELENEIKEEGIIGNNNINTTKIQEDVSAEKVKDAQSKEFQLELNEQQRKNICDTVGEVFKSIKSSDIEKAKTFVMNEFNDASKFLRVTISEQGITFADKDKKEVVRVSVNEHPNENEKDIEKGKQYKPTVDIMNNTVILQGTLEKDETNKSVYNDDSKLAETIESNDENAMKAGLKSIFVEFLELNANANAVTSTIDTVYTLSKDIPQYILKDFDPSKDTACVLRWTPEIDNNGNCVYNLKKVETVDLGLSKKVEMVDPGFLERLGNSISLSEKQIKEKVFSLYLTSIVGAVASAVIGSSGGFIVAFPVGYIVKKIYRDG